MKTRQIHGLGLGEFLIFAPAKEMLKSAYFFSALALCAGIFSFFIGRRRIDNKNKNHEALHFVVLMICTIFG